LFIAGRILRESIVLSDAAQIGGGDSPGYPYMYALSSPPDLSSKRCTSEPS